MCDSLWHDIDITAPTGIDKQTQRHAYTHTHICKYIYTNKCLLGCLARQGAAWIVEDFVYAASMRRICIVIQVQYTLTLTSFGGHERWRLPINVKSQINSGGTQTNRRICVREMPDDFRRAG